MTPDQIHQLRTLLKNTRKDCLCVIHEDCPCCIHWGEQVDKALALLPCPTCNGTRNVGGSGDENEEGKYIETETVPCPDCQ